MTSHPSQTIYRLHYTISPSGENHLFIVRALDLTKYWRYSIDIRHPRHKMVIALFIYQVTACVHHLAVATLVNRYILTISSLTSAFLLALVLTARWVYACSVLIPYSFRTQNFCNEFFYFSPMKNTWINRESICRTNSHSKLWCI